MENLFSIAWILFAQGGEGGVPEGGNGSFLQLFLYLFLPIGILFWFMILRPQKREAARRREMLEAVKKNDRVITIGGICGVVTSVMADKGRVVIRIDENAKLEMLQSAIARVVTDSNLDDK